MLILILGRIPDPSSHAVSWNDSPLARRTRFVQGYGAGKSARRRRASDCLMPPARCPALFPCGAVVYRPWLLFPNIERRLAEPVMGVLLSTSPLYVVPASCKDSDDMYSRSCWAVKLPCIRVAGIGAVFVRTCTGTSSVGGSAGQAFLLFLRECRIHLRLIWIKDEFDG